MPTISKRTRADRFGGSALSVNFHFLFPQLGVLSGSVWESNPLGALFKPPTGFEDQGEYYTTAMCVSTCSDYENYKADCWALLVQIDPDLVQLAQQWPQLSDTLKAAILSVLNGCSVINPPSE